LSADAPTGTATGNCATTFFREITGVYDGEITYTSDTLSCRWNVDFEIATATVSGTAHCGSSANITSDLLFGDRARCGDIAQAGDFQPTVSGGSTVADLNAVTWPVDGFMVLNAETDGSIVYPIGRTGASQYIDIRFDGSGNVTMPQYNDAGFDGVLVKQ